VAVHPSAFYCYLAFVRVCGMYRLW